MAASGSYQPLAIDDTAVTLPTASPRSRRRTIVKRTLIFAAVLAGIAWLWLAFAPSRSESESRAPTSDPIPYTPETAVNETLPGMSGKHSVGYFVNWGIYGRKYPPSQIPVQDLTHVLYAFANIRGDTGEVVLSDIWADQDIHYPGDSWNEPQGYLCGNFKAIYNLKKQNRNLKVLLSIGGWTYSPQFHPVVISPGHRAKFVESSIRILEDYGLDGLDIDYEYPSNPEQAWGYVELLRELRRGLDMHAQRKGANYRFLLTIAAPCGPDNYQKLYIREMDEVLSMWNLMSYDFSGSWDQVAGHQANLLGQPVSAHQAISFYIQQGVHPSKIIMGIPLYGRSFANTGGPGTTFNGVGRGSWEQGVLDYRTLPLPGAQVFRDDNIGASWSYDQQRQEMVSFDDEAIAWHKGQYIAQQGLGGSMFWELSGDKGSVRQDMEGGLEKEERPGRSLVRVVKEGMGGLANVPNWLQYEGSKFENMRNGMP